MGAEHSADPHDAQVDPPRAAARPRVVVAYPSERDVMDWEARHAQGLVPGRWPYGLDELARVGLEVGHRPLPPSGPVRRRAAVIAERVLPTGKDEVTYLTWDENAAVRLAARPRLTPRASGVVWVTDRPREAVSPIVLHALRGCRSTWTLSAAQVQPLRDLLGQGGPPVRMVRFGVDHNFWSAAPYPERPLVLSVGGDRDRDTTTLFGALGRVRSAVPEAEVVVQTTSTERPPDGVKVVRHLPHHELRDLYRQASVVALATRPNLHVSGMTVSLEAMATARPVVITGSPGIDDYVRDGRGGVVVPGGDGEALADAVIDLLREPDRAAAMGRTGRANVESRHTHATLAAELLRALSG